MTPWAGAPVDPRRRRRRVSPGLVARILRSWGHAVIGEAGSVAEALTCADALRPDQEVTMSVPPTTGATQTGDGLAGRLKRTEIQHKGSSIPGREIVQVLTEIPCGVESGWHFHPGEEVGYIAAGTVLMEIAGRPPRTLQAGEGFLIPPGTPHNARDLGPGTSHMLSTYIVETGQPLVTLIP
jgi:quercetin dioxygenase-like cupin family protein